MRKRRNPSHPLPLHTGLNSSKFPRDRNQLPIDRTLACCLDASGKGKKAKKGDRKESRKRKREPRGAIRRWPFSITVRLRTQSNRHECKQIRRPLTRSRFTRDEYQKRITNSDNLVTKYRKADEYRKVDDEYRITQPGHLERYPITVVCSGRILYITRTSPGFAYGYFSPPKY